MDDNARYLEWLRAGSFVDITPQVVATFAAMVAAGARTRPAHAILARSNQTGSR